uniref:Serpentine receptor class gamma n=1 Tax=Caenorhabditis tropicalis TaxID=1561998 RepID=A0A1I7V071_9PELO
MTRSFYRLVAVHLIFVILSWINSWPSRMVYTEDFSYFAKVFFKHFPKLFNFFMVLGIAFLHFQSISSIIICINRLRMANPLKYKERNDFWNRWFILIYTVVLIVSCLAGKFLAFPPTVDFFSETGKFRFIVWSLVR